MRRDLKDKIQMHQELLEQAISLYRGLYWSKEKPGRSMGMAALALQNLQVATKELRADVVQALYEETKSG